MNPGFDLEGGIGATALSFIGAALVFFPKLRWIPIPFQSYVGSDIDFTPYLARHAAGDWGELDASDKQQNNLAVKEGYRILSAYKVPLSNGETERIWIITEWDRSVTTVLTPREY